MSPSGSITSAASFQSTLVRAEAWRITMIALCLVIVLTTWIVRRAMGEVVASNDGIFYPTVWLLGLAILSLIVVLAEVRSRIRKGLHLPEWRTLAGSVMDVAVPFGLLLIAHLRSPRGEMAALAGPILFVFPVIILLSVLRLRVLFPALIGLVAAASHWFLVIRTYTQGEMPASLLPLYFGYGILLVMTGLAAGVLTHFVRGYVQEAIREAQIAERATRSLASIEHELNIARDIQMSLLPVEPPPLPGFEFAGMARPAAHAGGDYYDWQMLSDGRCVVAVADVTGHGVGPAMVMAVCRAYARATVPMVATAEQFLERINNLVTQDLHTGRFITMAVAIVGPDGSIDLLSAGHGPTFLYKDATGQVTRFGGSGLPLGVMAEERYSPTENLRMERGDVLVMLTDGFMERASTDGKIFGLKRLTETVAACASRSAKEIIAAIDAEVSHFGTGSPQGDDMTIVVLRRT
ncbi:MAG: serine/threonine-protein phosphatase [Phycisphaeraceae bacterium]|nr:serine/threonine-protein phosphatase [Phycisphaeraceae bacterium]